ncbi:hypothetical protein [Pseudoteredinibacter isoporae]|uniref:Uncharacterized protein n=1 Tax=Pseudoteredinibacter isoporae TaxID=570281 RepID=A0A7X0JUX2_9GAMM|nr:hypothetical protein [Pseudoteredinibacter isoporae]MBB6521846.1 hypothetical protein [Pseudoteredinibacter isoporae]NHO87390.1 hypothetical protein [Pseudoteredinibacter isoporae]NIB22505.1 hypothetical protein [Pseudoteredinibacter isoporae]
MDVALCLLDGERYDIANFCKLPPVRLGQLRRALICEECQGKGYYTKQSRDGKAAYFGAYHEDSCPIKLKKGITAPKLDPHTVEEVNGIITNNDIIDVNFSAYTSQQLTPPSSNSTHANTGSPTHSRQHTRQASQIRNTNKGLRSLLRMLMHSDTFAHSDITINMGGQYHYKAKNLFVNFDDIYEELANKKKMRGYWGVISNADEEINWLNTANEQDVSIPVSGLKDYLTEVFGISDAEDLSGATVLVFGWLKVSKSKHKKWYINVHNNDPAYLFVKLKKE